MDPAIFVALAGTIGASVAIVSLFRSATDFVLRARKRRERVASLSFPVTYDMLFESARNGKVHYKIERQEPVDFEGRLSAAFDRLQTAVKETQNLLGEFGEHVEERAKAARQAEETFRETSEKESTLRKSVESLEKIEPEAIKIISSAIGQQVSSGEKRGLLREMLFFLGGVVVSVPVGIWVNYISG